MPPGKGKKSFYAGGWNSAKADQMDKVQVPPKISCSACKKYKSSETYSKRQISDLKHHILLGNEIKTSKIRCRQCTGAQTHEMTCAICGETKGLDGFSKAQRRTPDSARCCECVNEHLATRPGVKEDWDISSDSSSDDEEGSDNFSNNFDSSVYEQTGSDVDGVSSSMQRLTTQNLEHIGGSEKLKRGGSEAYTGAYSVASTREKMPPRSMENNPAVNNWTTYARANSKRPTEYTGYDAAGAAHRQVRAPSTTASGDYGSFRAPRGSNAGKTKNPNRQFAKLPRVPTPPPPPIITRFAPGRQVEYSDPESDDDFGTIP